MMSNKNYIHVAWFFALFMASLLPYFPSPGYAQSHDDATKTSHAIENSVDLTILADEHLRLPLTLVARDYSRHGKGSVTLWFVETPAMVDTIRDGADADMVITADKSAIAQLENSGQINVYATQTIATSPLVVAASEQSPLISSSNTLSLLDWRFNSTETRHIITITGQDTTQRIMVDKAFDRSDLLRNSSIKRYEVRSLKQAFSSMETLYYPALMLAVDAFSQPGIRIIQRFPNNIVAPARFKVAILASDHMQPAHDFIAYIQRPKAQELLKSYGLSSVTIPR